MNNTDKERIARTVALMSLFLFVNALVPAKGQGLGGLLHRISKPGHGHSRDTGKKGDNLDSLIHLKPYYGPKKRIAVMSLDVKISTNTLAPQQQQGGSNGSNTIDIPPPTDLGTGLTEMLTTALVHTHRFILLERAALQDIQAEQQLGTSGALNPATVPKTGALLGAQALVRGAVTEYSYQESSTGAGGILGRIGLSHADSTAMVGMDIRLYDTTTGQILNSVHAVGRARSSATSVNYTDQNINVGSQAFSQSPIGEACRRAIAQAVLFICSKMAAVPWQGRIADIEPGDNNGPATLYINAGKDAGLKVGDKLEILKPGHDIVDPDTQTVIGHVKDVPEGAGHIQETRDHIAIVAVDSGTGFQVGDAVRFINPSTTADNAAGVSASSP